MAAATATAILAGAALAYTVHSGQQQKKEAKQEMKKQAAQQRNQEQRLVEQEQVSKANENRSRQLNRQRAMAAGAQGRSSTLLGGTTGGSQISGGKSLLGS